MKDKESLYQTFKKALTSVLQLILGTSMGLLGYRFFPDLSIIDICLIHLIGVIGIIIPGYIFAKANGNTDVLSGAIFSSITCTFLGIFIYVIFAYFLLSGLEILNNKIAAIAIPIACGIFGFNIFIFTIRGSQPPINK